jgi:hypothetical protein
MNGLFRSAKLMLYALRGERLQLNYIKNNAIIDIFKLLLQND